MPYRTISSTFNKRNLNITLITQKFSSKSPKGNLTIFLNFEPWVRGSLGLGLGLVESMCEKPPPPLSQKKELEKTNK